MIHFERMINQKIVIGKKYRRHSKIQLDFATELKQCDFNTAANQYRIDILIDKWDFYLLNFDT